MDVERNAIHVVCFIKCHPLYRFAIGNHDDISSVISFEGDCILLSINGRHDLNGWKPIALMSENFMFVHSDS